MPIDDKLRVVSFFKEVAGEEKRVFFAEHFSRPAVVILLRGFRLLLGLAHDLVFLFEFLKRFFHLGFVNNCNGNMILRYHV